MICVEQPVERFAVVRLLEELDDGVGHHLADPLDGVEVLIGLRLRARGRGGDAVAQRFDRSVMAREQLRVGLADMADAERENQPVERDGAPRLDSREEVAHGKIAEPFLLFELDAAVALRKREDVGRLLDPAALEEQLDLLVAQAFDVEGEARGKMLQALHHLGAADEAAGAAAHHVLLAGARIDLAHRVAAAHRADRREYVGLRIAPAASRSRRRAPAG